MPYPQTHLEGKPKPPVPKPPVPKPPVPPKQIQPVTTYQPVKTHNDTDDADADMVLIAIAFVLCIIAVYAIYKFFK